jgi:hypothetical protein
MNTHFRDTFGSARPTLPLGAISTIHCGNSLRLDWLAVCAKNDEGDTYICGNPPYLGTANQNADQKNDVHLLFSPLTKMRTNIDYVGCFFLKAAAYIHASAGKAAFVSTNSVCQGEQVPILWPLIYAQNVTIDFAYSSFKWQNNASNNAGVTCIIVGLTRTDDKRPKTLYSADHVNHVKVIGPYLVPGTTCIVDKAPNPINGLPEMIWGSQPLDGGHFILSPSERGSLLLRHPEANALIRRYAGSDDFINHVERYCIWITEKQRGLADGISEIKKRVERVKSFRKASTAKTTQQYGNNPYRMRPNRFNHLQDEGTPAIIIPCVSSERRSYITVGVTDGGTIINNLAFAVYDPPQHLLALLSSRLHRTWASTVGGKLEDRLRYSNSLVYNTFPVPALSAEQKRILANHSRAILTARAKHPGKTIAWLYNPETMPSNLLEAHEQNDAYLEKDVYGRSFKDDVQRLEHLFVLYERLKSASHNEVRLFANLGGETAVSNV